MQTCDNFWTTELMKVLTKWIQRINDPDPERMKEVYVLYDDLHLELSLYSYHLTIPTLILLEDINTNSLVNPKPPPSLGA